MKEYNRKTRKWEEKSTEQVGSIKKPKMCRGGQSHQMRLVLPDHIMRVNRDLSPEAILAWYESKDRVYAFAKEENKKMELLGFIDRYGWYHQEHRILECEVCGKKQYELD